MPRSHSRAPSKKTAPNQVTKAAPIAKAGQKPSQAQKPKQSKAQTSPNRGATNAHDRFQSTALFARRLACSFKALGQALLQILRLTAHHLDRFCRFFGKVSAFLLPFLMLVIVGDILLRAMGFSYSVPLQELAWHLHACVFLFALSAAYCHDRHVRIALFSENLSPRRRAFIEWFGISFLLFPYCFALIYFGFDYVSFSWAYQEASPSPNGLPYRFFIKSVMLFGFFLLFLAGLAKWCTALLEILTQHSVNQQQNGPKKNQDMPSALEARLTAIPSSSSLMASADNGHVS